jgi:MFS family permease
MRPLAKTRAFTTLTFFANGFGMGAWSVAIATVKSALHASDGQMGFALLAFGLGAIFAMPFAGFAASRIGAGKMCALCGAAFSLCLAGPALAPSILSLALVLLFLGISNGSLDVVMNARASQVESDWRSPLMSSFHAAWSAGGLLGAGCAGLMAESHWSLRSTLFIPSAIVAVLMIPACVNGFRNSGSRSEASITFAIPGKGVAALGAIAFLSLLTEGGIAGWTSIYLREELPGGSGSYAIGYGAFALSMAICRLCGDRIVRHYGPRVTVIAGASLAALGFSIVLLWPTLVIACLAFVMVGLGLGNIVPVIFSAAGKQPVGPSQGVAMTATAGYAGFLIGPPVIGTIAQLTSLRIALAAQPIATILIALMARRFLRPMGGARDVKNQGEFS